MDAEAVNTAGGICELAGLGLAVREYLAALQHHGHLADARRRLTQVWGAIVARWRRFRGRPAGVVHWYRVQQRDPQQRYSSRVFQTLGLYCSPGCLAADTAPWAAAG
jgi:hypothetical protein